MKADEDKAGSDSDGDSDSSDGGYLHPSLISNTTARVMNNDSKTRTPSPQTVVDESHPLYRIINQRRELDRQKEIEKENLEKRSVDNSQSWAATTVQVPPPDICQTVEWVSKELAGATAGNDRVQKEQRLKEQSTLDFMHRGHTYYNYFQTILQRTLLTSTERSYSPPPPPSASKIAYQSNGAPISFKITKPLDNTGAEKRKEEAIKKAHEVAQAIEARKIHSKEIENKLAARARERLIEENNRQKESDQAKRDSHQQMVEIRESANLVKQGLIPPPPTTNPSDSDERKDRSRERKRDRSRTPKRKKRTNSRSRSRSRSRYSSLLG